MVWQNCFDEGLPFGFEGRAAVGFSSEAIPVVGVPFRAFLAVEVGVDGHRVGGFEVVDESVGAGPIAFGVPPEGFERRCEIGWRGDGGEGLDE